MKAYILIKIHTGEISAVVNQLRKVEGVTEAHMTFGPYDAVAAMESRDIQHLGRMISSAVQPIPGIQETLTCIATDV